MTTRTVQEIIAERLKDVRARLQARPIRFSATITGTSLKHMSGLPDKEREPNAYLAVAGALTLSYKSLGFRQEWEWRTFAESLPESDARDLIRMLEG